MIERDGWAPYRRVTHAAHQSCLAHLLRRCREMIGDSIAGQARIPHQLRRILNDALAARDDALAGDELADAITELQARIARFCAATPTHDPNRRLVGHIRNEQAHLLTFLTTPGVQATNWRAEQAIRPLVVNRKNWGGNLTRRGADTTMILGSVLRTARQQHHNPLAVLTAIQTGQPAGLRLARSP